MQNRYQWQVADLFQFTRPRGARRPRAAEGRDDQVVSIHAPARGATAADKKFCPIFQCFNSRAREGRDAGRGANSEQTYRFNSRAREGRDMLRLFERGRREEVSIHAPARGATICCSS